MLHTIVFALLRKRWSKFKLSARMQASAQHASTSAEGKSFDTGLKGAWDCDARCRIAPERQAQEFEEIATMEYPFEGIPTVPPRKDMDRMAFFCGGCRYRVTAYPEWPVMRVKQALWDGGIQQSNRASGQSNTPGLQRWQDLTLIYAGRIMENEALLQDYQVPHGCKCLVAIETAKLTTDPDPDSAFWT